MGPEGERELLLKELYEGKGKLGLKRGELIRELRDALKLDKDSKVLLFSTEGDTDPERWKNIVWYGKDK